MKKLQIYKTACKHNIFEIIHCEIGAVSHSSSFFCLPISYIKHSQLKISAIHPKFLGICTFLSCIVKHGGGSVLFDNVYIPPISALLHFNKKSMKEAECSVS